MKKFLVLFIAILSVAIFATSFKDVPVNHWAYDAVNKLSNLSIISGLPDGTFQGNSTLNRYQFAVA